MLLPLDMGSSTPKLIQSATITLLRKIEATPTTAAALLRRVDLPGPLGDATKAIVGAGQTVAGVATQGAGTANDIKETADQVRLAKEKFDYYYGLWTKYKGLIYLAMIILGIIVLMCFINCAIQWCQNCCFCVKCGYKCTKWGCKGLGWCCIQSKHCVFGLHRAVENAHRRGKEYDGMDQTGWRRWLLGGQQISDDLKEAAHQKWWGDTRGWFGRNVAWMWGGDRSRIVRDFADKGREVWIRWDGDGRLETYKARGRGWVKSAQAHQKKLERKLAKRRGRIATPTNGDIEAIPALPPPYSSTTGGAAQRESDSQSNLEEKGV